MFRGIANNFGSDNENTLIALLNIMCRLISKDKDFKEFVSKTAFTDFKTRVDTLVDLLAHEHANGSMNYYHSIRIEIKKIRALFNLIEFSYRDFRKKKYFKPFKKVLPA